MCHVRSVRCRENVGHFCTEEQMSLICQFGFVLTYIRYAVSAGTEDVFFISFTVCHSSSPPPLPPAGLHGPLSRPRTLPVLSEARCFIHVELPRNPVSGTPLRPAPPSFLLSRPEGSATPPPLLLPPLSLVSSSNSTHRLFAPFFLLSSITPPPPPPMNTSLSVICFSYSLSHLS